MKRIKLTICVLSLLLVCLTLACTTSSDEKIDVRETPEPIPMATPQKEAEITPTPQPRLTMPPLPTEAPTPEPTPEPTETPTPSPTPTPTPEPEPFTFTESEDFPMPDPDGPILRGHPFWIDGTVRSVRPLTRVSAVIKDAKDKVLQEAKLTYEESANVTECRLLDLTFSNEINCIAENLRFNKLAAGSYVLEISAEDAAGHSETLRSAKFTITSSKKAKLLPNNFRGSYTTALKFFGSPERFLFTYQFRDGNSISIDNEWLKKYDAEATVINGKKWRCHVDAVPYFEQAGRYMENTYVRVHGDRFDSGAVRLADLVEMNGTAVRRFVKAGDFVSHHAFGTAVDINAYTASHRNNLQNREKIYHEVKDNLTYNGIVEVNGKQCYDFTYTGKAAAVKKRIPEPLMNYLLYELAFYRAGFSWGLYYPHTSDAMHFTLTELSPTYFEEGPYALRKVFTYLEDGAATTP